MNSTETFEEIIEKKFVNAVDYFGIHMPNLLNFYALFTRRVNNKIASFRICVKRDVTPVFEYNEEWLTKIDYNVFNFILAIELYRFITHHPTHRELVGTNAFKASTAVSNSPELQFFLDFAPADLAEAVKKSIWSKQIIETEINRKISNDDWYYESVFEILNQNDMQNQSQEQNSSGDQNSSEDQNSSGQEDPEESSQSSSGSEEDDSEEQNGGSSQSGEDEDSDSSEGGTDGDSDDSEEDSDDESDEGDKDGNGKGKNKNKDDKKDGESESDRKSDKKNGEGDKKDLEKSEGDGKGDGESDVEDPSRSSELKENAEADPSKAKNKTGNSFQDWNKNAEENAEEWGRNPVVDQMIRETFEHTKVTGWGKLSGDQISNLELANKRKVNVTPIISSFATSVRTRKRFSTRMRYNKRYGLVFPGYRLDRKSRILFAIDSSGSMSDLDILKGCEILHNFLKKCEIDLAFWDAQMVDPVKFTKNFKKVTAPGRGGTDPHCIGEYLDKHPKLHYDGVIIFTDCWWDWSENNLDASIFVISSQQEYNVPSFVKHHASIQELTHVFDD